MFRINEDMSIYITRGDTATFTVSAKEDTGVLHTFVPGDTVRLKITEKKNCGEVVLEKDFPVFEETTSVVLVLSGEETRFGEVISKPRDYWYEVELNPETAPQTIIGYDEEGAKIFRLYPEGDENG